MEYIRKSAGRAMKMAFVCTLISRIFALPTTEISEDKNLERPMVELSELFFSN